MLSIDRGKDFKRIVQQMAASGCPVLTKKEVNGQISDTNVYCEGEPNNRVCLRCDILNRSIQLKRVN
jgi:hypothetical protein